MENRHFYVCTGDTWVTDTDLHKALDRLKKATYIKKAYYLVVDVPLPPDATYQINGYMPQVEGARVITDGYFSGGRK